MPSSPTIDLAALGLKAGEARRLAEPVELAPIVFGDSAYAVDPVPVPVTIDVTRLVRGGWSLRLRFAASLHGPCMRCLRDAAPVFELEAREIDAEDDIADGELDSPYVEADRLDVHAWTRDVLMLALPAQILCEPDCPGLCPVCGADLREQPDHRHERDPDPRWAVLGELRFDEDR